MARSGGDFSAASPGVEIAVKSAMIDSHPLMGAIGKMASQDSINTAASDAPYPPPPGSAIAASRGGSSQPPEDWGLSIGSPFPSTENPKYIIKAEIDDGGMGVVYEAHQGELGVVAIKVIKPRILGQAASERFLNEARAMAKVRAEPGIATIFDCDWYNDTATGSRAPFIVMEYVPGGLPITNFANEHRLSLRARLQLLQKVCEAVAAAHRADIIHRDLKPANVMVTASGNPKVIDFGLAVVHDQDEHAKRLPSERGGLFGTLEYMSPEQAAKRFDPHVLTAASDVYSLGVILYELLLGRLPYAEHPGFAVKKFESGTADYAEATRIIREDAPVAPHRLNRSIHPGVEAILLKALEKEPAKRYRTAGEMSAAIAGHLRWGRRRDLLVAAPIVLLAVWLAGIIGVPLFFSWTPVSGWYYRAATAMSPPIGEFKHVAIVTVDEKTDVGKFGKLAVADQEKLGFGIGERTRPLLGALCAKLAKTGCRVAALDMYYDTDAIPGTGDDEALLKGVAALKAAGVDWVMLSRQWKDRTPSWPRVVTESGALTGSPWLHPEPTGWRVQAALERDGQVMPSFSLVTAALYKHPQSSFVFHFDNVSFGVKVTSLHEDGSQVLDKKTLGVTQIVHGDAPEVHLDPTLTTDVYQNSDRLAFLVLPPFPDDKALQAAAVPADELMAMSDEEARVRCRDRVVVLANRHVDFKELEWAHTPDGRLVPKSYGHALAIETFLQGESTIRTLDRYAEIGATVFAAMLGVGIAMGWPSRWTIMLVCGAASVVALIALSLVIVRLNGYMCNPIIPGLALLLAMTMGACTPVVLRALRAVLSVAHG